MSLSLCGLYAVTLSVQDDISYCILSGWVSTSTVLAYIARKLEGARACKVVLRRERLSGVECFLFLFR